MDCPDIDFDSCNFDSRTFNSGDKVRERMNHRTFQAVITSCRINPSYHYDSFVRLDCFEALNLII
jgi:hypothetical protein